MSRLHCYSQGVEHGMHDYVIDSDPSRTHRLEQSVQQVLTVRNGSHSTSRTLEQAVRSYTRLVTATNARHTPTPYTVVLEPSTANRDPGTARLSRSLETHRPPSTTACHTCYRTCGDGERVCVPQELLPC